MCINPIIVKGQPRACRECKQCIANKKRDWVGRCAAERLHATQVYAVTLTYRDDPIEASHAIFRRSHVLKYVRSIRDAGYPLRYFFVGERGSKLGRVHWHVLLFFKGKLPPVWKDGAVNHKHALRLDWNCDQKFWPHGYSKYEVCRGGSPIYYMKYIGKEIDETPLRDRLGFSLKPELGADYFRDLAQRYVDHGLAPQDRYYKADGKLMRNGMPFEYCMTRGTWHRFCDSYLELFKIKHGNDNFPASDALYEHLDLRAKQAADKAAIGAPVLDEDKDRRRWLAKRKRPDHLTKPHICPRTGVEYSATDTRAAVFFDRQLMVWRYPAVPEKGVQNLFWTFDSEGQRDWFPWINPYGAPVFGDLSHEPKARLEGRRRMALFEERFRSGRFGRDEKPFAARSLEQRYADVRPFCKGRPLGDRIKTKLPVRRFVMSGSS